MHEHESEEAAQRRLEREAREVSLGTLGDRSGVNVAKVEVSWAEDFGSDGYRENAGHFFVHATGNEPEAQGEEGTIYAVFENLTHTAMQERQQRDGFDSYQIDDISAA